MTLADLRALSVSFLDRTVDARRHEKPAEGETGIIPGNRGKAGRNWCGPPLCGSNRRRHMSPVPLDGVAAGPVMRHRNCAARRESRNRAESSQVQGRFRALHRCSYPEGCGCYCMTRTQRSVPVGPPHRKARPARQGAKGTRRGGEQSESGKAREPPPWGGAKNASPNCKSKAT